MNTNATTTSFIYGAGGLYVAAGIRDVIAVRGGLLLDWYGIGVSSGREGE